MTHYLNHTFDINDPDLISVIDDLPLWSAPFGLKLLDAVKFKKNIIALDLGCGLGFPLVELAARLGDSCQVYGLDPWEPALERARLKLKVYNIKNVKLISGYAEKMPFETDFFDLIVSNNGINNVQDLAQTLKECNRISKPKAQFVFTMNSDQSMIEFYSIFQQVLNAKGLMAEIEKTQAHIYSKRRPLTEIKSLLTAAGFSIITEMFDCFNLRFADASAMFNHYFIKYWFLGSWKEILKSADLVPVFTQVESLLNEQAEKEGELSLSVPFVTMDCRKK
jgi:arsenite methyltransferase